MTSSQRMNRARQPVSPQIRTSGYRILTTSEDADAQGSPVQDGRMRLTIRGRLIAVVGLSLVPIALLGYLFVAQSQKDIAFGSKEMDGAQYYAALAPDLAALTDSGKPGDVA